MSIKSNEAFTIIAISIQMDISKERALCLTTECRLGLKKDYK